MAFAGDLEFLFENVVLRDHTLVFRKDLLVECFVGFFQIIHHSSDAGVFQAYTLFFDILHLGADPALQLS